MSEHLPGTREHTALALYEWYETTHGNEFGHDHHCPQSREGTGRGEGDCSCGWMAFRDAEDTYVAATTPKRGAP
jgi:hypothetical protein